MREATFDGGAQTTKAFRDPIVPADLNRRFSGFQICQEGDLLGCVSVTHSAIMSPINS